MPAAMQIPRPGTVPRPGRCPASTPSTPPRKIAGNVGPPRNEPRHSPYAAPLHSSRSSRTPTGHVWSTSPGRACCPDPSTSTGDRPVTRANRPARAPVSTPAATATRMGRGAAAAAARRPRTITTCMSSATAAARGIDEQQVGRVERRRADVGQRQGAGREPGPVPEPGEEQGADPAGDDAGHDHEHHRVLARPTTSSIRMTATSGLPKMVAIAAADPAAAIRARPCGVGAQLRPVRGEERQPAAESDQRRLRPDDRAERQAGEGGERPPGRVRGSVSPPARPSAGTCPPAPGRYRIAAPTRARPGPAPAAAPGRRRGPAELVRQVLPDQLLQPLRPGEEAERERRQRQGEHGRGNQQQDVPTAA